MSGRVNRSAFWMGMVGVALLAALGTWLKPDGDSIVVLLAVALSVGGVPRMHDTGHSGWWLVAPFVLVLLAPLIARGAGLPTASTTYGMELAVVALLVVIGLVPSQPGTNRYGEPAPRRRLSA